MSTTSAVLDDESGHLPGSDVSPLRELLKLALPTVAQMISYTLMQFIDTWMLAHKLGELAPTASSNAGSLSFAFIGFGVGALLVVNTLVSQSFGQKNYANCGRYLWQGVWFALVYAVVLLPLCPLIIRAFTWFKHEPPLIAMERIYVYYTIGSAVIKLVQIAFSQYLLATNRANVVLLATIAGVSVNALAAYVMVFGKFGVEPMGVTGAAIALVIGTFIELIILLMYSLRRHDREMYNSADWKLRWHELRTLAKVGVGSGIQLIAEVLAWSLFMNLVMGELGTKEMSAMAFMLRYLIVSFLPALGISSAVTALVGRYIGMGRPDLAMHRAHLGFQVTLFYVAFCGVLFFVFRRPLMSLFAHDPDVLRMGMQLMVIAAMYQLFDAMYIVYYGALRGAGDTFVPAIITAVLCWGLMVGGGYIAARYFKQFSVAGPWAVAFVYGVILGIWMLVRFRRAKWQSIHLEHSNAADGSNRLTGADLAIAAR